MDPWTDAIGLMILYWLLLIIVAGMVSTLVARIFTGAQAMFDSQVLCWLKLHRYRKTDDVYIKKCNRCDKLKLPRGIDVN